MPETHDVAWTPEKVAATWDFFSDQLGGGDMYFSSHSGRWIVRRVERELGIRGKRVLDFGCGRGDLLAHLFRNGIAAEGFEVSQESADVTRRRFAGEPLFRGVATSADALPDESFDVVFLVEVIEHLLDEQVEPVLAEVRRVLAPAGRVVVTCPNGENLSDQTVRCPDCGAAFHRWQHVRSLDTVSIARLFEAHGFRTESSRGVYWGLTPFARFRTLVAERGRLPQPHLLYVATR